MNHFFSYFLLMLAFSSVSMALPLVTSYPRSCKDIKNQLNGALSGLYDIAVNNTVLTVYCEMAKNGGGFTFIPRQAIEKGKLPSLVKQLFTDRSQVLLRIQNKNGLQPYTLIRPLSGNSEESVLTVLQHHYSGFTCPQNGNLKDYLFLGILPASLARQKNTQGFISNDKQVTFHNCDANPNSYFAFFPNHREQTTNNYHGSNLVYEKQGVAVNWRRTGIPSFGHRQVPNDFFFLTEIHMGGCGCYTSSDRWTDAFGAAIGLR